MFSANSWILRQSGGKRRQHLYCFSYAGGNAASFIPWQAGLGSDIEVCAVQLPGRGARLDEPLQQSFSSLIMTLAHVIGRQSTLPYAFFGHSLGGLVAFELARYCQHHSLAMPNHLFVSGCDAPQHRSSFKRLHELGDDALLDALKDYNGTSLEALGNRELMALVLPAIRGDFALMSDYQYRPSPPMTLPITVLAGRGDKHVDSTTIWAWQKETVDACRINWFDGDHFFINSNRAAVLECLKSELVKRL